MLLIAAVGVYALLLISGVVPNPLPGIWEWVGQERPLAPDLAWQERLGARPGAAVVVGDTVTAQAGGRAEVRDREDGKPLHPTDPPGWAADWLLAAGAGTEAVVVTGEWFSDGYQVREPATGELLYQDEDAVAVWGYQDARLDLVCDDQRACQLRGFGPASGTPEWTTDLPGHWIGIQGANPELAGARTADPERIAGAAAGPPRLPRLLGFPVERRGGDAVAVVDTRTGDVRQVLDQADGEKILVVGERVIRSVTAPRNGVCLSTVTAHDGITGEAVWGPESFHVWASDGCEQRTPPLSGGAALAVVAPDARPVVLDANDGRVLWVGSPEQSVVALSPELAVIHSREQGTLSGVTLGGDGTPRWERAAEPDAEVLITPCGVVVADRDPNRVYVWDSASGEVLLSAPTGAKVLACGPDGLVLAGGRSLGYARFGTGVEGDLPGGQSPPLEAK